MRSDYVLDIPYTANFYSQLAPQRLMLAAMLGRHRRGRALPESVYELGIGQGFGIALLAAANPDMRFEGCDFNADHVVQARRFVDDAALDNLTVSQSSFAAAARHEGARDFDIVLAHGILSWVAAEVREDIVSFVSRRLRDEGLFCVSYNTPPGWAPLAPVRDLMREVKRRTEGNSHMHLAQAMQWLNTLRRSNAPLFTNNPAAGRHVDAMLAMDPAYLAHEYLAEAAVPLAFAEVTALFGSATLVYAGSAKLADNFDTLGVPAAALPLLAQTDDDVLRETLRDFATNRSFRSDVFGRGLHAISPQQRYDAIGSLQFRLTVPREQLNLAFHGPAGALNGRPDLYDPLVDRLAGQAVILNELEQLPAFQGRFDKLLECLVLLIDTEQACLVPPRPAGNHEPACRFNRMVVDLARRGRSLGHLASPVLGTGIPVSDFDLLGLAGIQDGVALDPAELAQHGLSIIKAQGRRPFQDGLAIEADTDAIDFLVEPMQCVIEQELPLWRQLGAV